MFWEDPSSSAPWTHSKEMLRTGKGGGGWKDREVFCSSLGQGSHRGWILNDDINWWCACTHAQSLQVCSTLCDPTDCTPPGSSVHGSSRQECRSGVTRPPLGDLPDQGSEAVCLTSPALAAGLFATIAIWEVPNPYDSLKEVSHSYSGLTFWPSRFSEWSFLFQLLKSDILLKLPEKLKMTPWHLQIVAVCPRFIKWYQKASLAPQMVKSLLAVQETWVRSVGWEDPLEKEMATYSSILAWETPWRERPGRPQSTGLQRVRHNWATNPHNDTKR